MSAVLTPGLASRDKMTMEDAFPKVEHLIAPLGNQVVVQLRCAKRRTAGGILLTHSDTDFDASQIRVAKVIELGPLSYKDRDTREDWPEGPWIKVGQFVRVPAYQGIDRWKIVIPDDTATREAQEMIDRERCSLQERIEDAEIRAMDASIPAHKRSSAQKDIETFRDRLKALPKEADPLTRDIYFAMFNDYDMKGMIIGDPLDIVDYV